MVRKSQQRSLKKKILIYCEGETEKNYFEMLKRKYRSNKVSSEKIAITTKVTGNTNPKEMVEEVIRTIKHTCKKNDIHQVYLLFDFDGRKKNDIETAIKLALENDIVVLYSNHCFELYLLSHYEKITGYRSDKQLYKALEKNMAVTSYSNDIKAKSKDLTPYFSDRIVNVIENCLHLNGEIHHNVMKNPYTNIHMYLKEIFQVTKL